MACKGEASKPLACLFKLFLFPHSFFWNETSAGMLLTLPNATNYLMTALLYGRLSQTGSSDRAMNQGLRLRISVFCWLVCQWLGFVCWALRIILGGFVASLSAPAVLGVSFIQLDIRRITWPKVKLNLRLHRIRFTCWLSCSQMTRTVVDTSLSTDKKMWFCVSC